MKPHRSPLPWLLLVLTGILLSGCATQYPVRVDALSASTGGEPFRGDRYQLINENPGEGGELFFKELERHLRPVLREAGFVEAGEAGRLDQVIAVKAYLSEPLVETRTSAEPIYARTPGHTQVVRIPIVNDKGQVVSYSYSSYWTPGRTEFAGYVNRDQQVTVYDKILELSGREALADGGSGEELWTVKVALRSQSTDYRSALPYMLVVAQPYVGKRTEGEERVLIAENDDAVEAYRMSLGDGR